MNLEQAKKEFAESKGFAGWYEIEDDHLIEAVSDEFAQFCLNQNVELKRFEVDCVDNQLFIFDENGKQLHCTDVTFCRMTFNGFVKDLQSEHQR